MKRLMLLLCCAMMTLNVFAQMEFAPIGATWYYDFPEDGVMNPNRGYIKVTSARDTTIAGKSARILEAEAHTSTGESFSLKPDIVHQSGDSIFYYVDGDFRLTYNFSLQIGDTMSIYANLNCFEYKEERYGSVVIDTIVELVIDERTIKVFYTSRTQDSQYEYCTFAEVLGSLGGLTSDYGIFDAGVCDGYYNVRCYHDSTINYEIEDCEYTYWFDWEAYAREQIKLESVADEAFLPIAVRQNGRDVVIEMPDECENYSVRLFDSNGRLVYDDIFVGRCIRFTTPRSGLYLFQVKSDNGIYNEKIIAY